jgi:citrate lyase subunit beta/citryl-CoA lyase
MSDEAAIDGAWSSGADVVVLDLTELVPERHKPGARERVKEAIGTVSRGGAEVYLQAGKDLLYADLKASVWRGLAGVVVPRLESASEASEAASLISQMEEEHGVLPGTIQMVPSLETAAGNFHAMEIARSSPRIWGLTLGRADLVMDLRPEPSGEVHLMPYLMQRIITVANAAGLVPLGAWWRAPARGLLAGPQDTEDAARRGSLIGFQGSMCLSTAQVGPLNKGFTPQPGEIRQAESMLRAFQEADRERRAPARLEDRILDSPTVESARRLIARARACTAMDEAKARAVASASEEAPEGAKSP